MVRHDPLVFAQLRGEDVGGVEFVDGTGHGGARHVQLVPDGRGKRRPQGQPRHLLIETGGTRRDRAGHLDRVVGLGFHARLAVGDREADVGVEVTVVDPRGPLVVPDRFLRPAQLDKDLAPEDQRVEVPRVDRDGPLEMVVGPLDVAQAHEEAGGPVVHVGVVRVHVENVANFVQGLLGHSLLFETLGQAAACLPVVGLDKEGVLVLDDGRLQVAAPGLKGGQVHSRLEVARFLVLEGRVLLGRFVQVSLHEFEGRQALCAAVRPGSAERAAR